MINRRSASLLAVLMSASLAATCPSAVFADEVVELKEESSYETNAEVNNEAESEDVEIKKIPSTVLDEYVLGTDAKNNISANDAYIHWYKLNLKRPAILDVSANVVYSGDADPNSTGVTVYSNTENKLCEIYGNQSEKTCLIKGTYYICEHADYPKANGTHSFSVVSFNSADNYQSFEEDYENVVTRNDTKECASVIAEDAEYHGLIGDNNFVDWYKLTVTNDKTYFNITGSNFRTGDMTCYIFSEDGSNVIDSCPIEDNKPYTATLEKGTYLIRVERTFKDNGAIGVLCSYIFNVNKDGSKKPGASHTKAADTYVVGEKINVKDIYFASANGIKKYKVEPKGLGKVSKKSGVFKAKKAGTVKIDALDGSGSVVSSCSLKILSKPKLKFPNGLTEKEINAYDYFSNKDEINTTAADSWSSSKTSVAEIDKDGNITVKGKGTTTIVANFGTLKVKGKLKIK